MIKGDEIYHANVKEHDEMEEIDRQTWRSRATLRSYAMF